tara:strand:+ start:543 stop:1898 length:1356 start_codon:yes stop_codon:yes gene_type:complete
LNYTVQKSKNKLEKKIFIKTLGCQMNEYDSDRIVTNLTKINYSRTNDPLEADCYILNTCHIREKATQKVYHDIGRVKKLFKNKKKPIVIVAGCVAQAEGEILMKREAYIDGVIGPQSYHYLNNVLLQIENKKKKIIFTEFEAENKFDDLVDNKNKDSKISSFLTIQEGCDKFCKFCVVPYTRGPEFSRKFNQIISEAKQLVDQGTKEIILLGQNVNAYDYSGKKLSDLIFSLDNINGLERIRYTTSHPRDMSDDLIKIHGVSKKLMPLLHLPVQSGSNKILNKMNRKHTIDEYLNVVEKLRKEKSTIEFSSDFIIAYPGETEEDFLKSVNLMKKIKFINTYSYIFSPRPGTPSAKLNLVESKIAKERLIGFQEISKKIKKDYKKKLIGNKVKVLFENKINNNQFFGRDEYHNSIVINSNKDIVGKTLEVNIKECNLQTIYGDLHNQKDAAA